MKRLGKIWFGLWCIAMLAAPTNVFAFALLGPPQPWMNSTNQVFFAQDDIGGPMKLGCGYRWNVPVLTYGFDASFFEYFGTNGVAAVQNAIQILNDLPPSSEIVLTNYPFISVFNNYSMGDQVLFDLKSQTLVLLLEQLGLADSSRYVYVLKQWSPSIAQYGFDCRLNPQYPYMPFGYWPDWFFPDYIDEFNIDPKTLSTSAVANDTFYVGYIANWIGANAWCATMPADPFAAFATSVAGHFASIGEIYSGLTYDDVGGLAYLYSTNTISFENLLPDVFGAGTNADLLVNGAWRPGVDKVTFVTQTVGAAPGLFLPMTNCYTDTYLTNGLTAHQFVQRVTTQPDILFSVSDIKAGSNWWARYSRSGTSRWLNNSALNGNADGSGPGVIQPPVQITFQRLGPGFSNYSEPEGAYPIFEFWASYADSTNQPIQYPLSQTNNTRFAVQMFMFRNNYSETPFKTFDWQPADAFGTAYSFQTSSNLTNWVNLFDATNNGTVWTYHYFITNSPTRFFRLIPR